MDTIMNIQNKKAGFYTLSLFIIAFALAFSCNLGFSAEKEDKSKYNLFNPTPRKLLRDLSADRPDVTESPITVDAGRVQLEMSFLDYTIDDWNYDDNKVETLTYGSTTLKFGLLHNMDLQVVFDSYIDEETKVDTTRSKSSLYGFGDTQLRLKTNLWGNDGGVSAAALMPFIKIPTAANDLGNDHIEGGLIIPMGYELAHGWGLGVMAEFDAVYDDEEHNHDFEFVHSAVLGHDLFGSLGWYGEYVGVSNSDSDSHYQAALGTGLTLGLNDDIQLDLGINAGLTKATDDFNVFFGITMRL
jgi:hypothetical protein